MSLQGEVLGQRPRTLLQQQQWPRYQHFLVPFSWAPIPTGWCKESQVTSANLEVSYGRRTLSLEKLDLSSWAVSKPNLCSRGRYYVFQGCSLESFFLRLFRTKSVVLDSAHKTCRKMWNPVRIRVSYVNPLRAFADCLCNIRCDAFIVDTQEQPKRNRPKQGREQPRLAGHPVPSLASSGKCQGK